APLVVVVLDGEEDRRRRELAVGADEDQHPRLHLGLVPRERLGGPVDPGLVRRGHGGEHYRRRPARGSPCRSRRSERSGRAREWREFLPASAAFLATGGDERLSAAHPHVLGMPVYRV